MKNNVATSVVDHTQQFQAIKKHVTLILAVLSQDDQGYSKINGWFRCKRMLYEVIESGW